MINKGILHYISHFTLQYAGYMTPGPMAMAGEELGPKDIITLKDSVLYPPPPSKYRETRPVNNTGACSYSYFPVVGVRQVTYHIAIQLLLIFSYISLSISLPPEHNV